jgi:signal transduction histidine kinase
LRASFDLAEASRKGLWYSPTYFKDGSEPFLTLAMRDRGPGGVMTLAEINLRYVGEVVSRIRIGAKGIVYVVDGADHVVAHPDVAVVLGKTSLSAYEPLRRVREASAGADVVGMFAARALDGSEVMISAARIASTKWLVVAEQPRSEVLGPLYSALTRTLAALLAGIVAALGASYLLARRLARPILELRRGAEKIARGDLTTRIDVRTGDDIETLARDFNRMADQLQDYTVGLERKVSEKTAELEAANRHKSEFLANMSHELRTPLNAVIGSRRRCARKCSEPRTPSSSSTCATSMARDCTCLSLINDILDLAKVESGLMELDLRVFDVGAAVGNCLTLVRERAMRQSLALTVDVPPGLTWCADERKFKQVLLNLLTNALKFTAAGGKVHVEARVEDGMLAMSVSDNGLGIAPADQGVIFEQFRQLADRQGVRQEGTGLGLPSRCGWWSCMAAPSPSRASRGWIDFHRAVSAAGGEMTAGRRVLVVEDDEKSRRLLRDVLGFHGFEVTRGRVGGGGCARGAARPPRRGAPRHPAPRHRRSGRPAAAARGLPGPPAAGACGHRLGDGHRSQEHPRRGVRRLRAEAGAHPRARRYAQRPAGRGSVVNAETGREAAQAAHGMAGRVLVVDDTPPAPSCSRTSWASMATRWTLPAAARKRSP